MAKISARGAYAVAEARKTKPTDEGTVEIVRTLCSDGRILVRNVWRYRRDGMRACSTGHTCKATLRSEVTPETANDWIRSMSERQFTARLIQAPPIRGEKAMSKKSSKQAPKGREHTIAKAMPARKETKMERIVSPDDLDQQTATPAHEAAHVAPVQAPAEPKATAPKSAPHGRPVAAAEAGESDDAGEMVVFAIRLTREERDAIHAVAGSGKATKLVRSLVVAAGQNAWIDTPTGRALLMGEPR